MTVGIRNFDGGNSQRLTVGIRGLGGEDSLGELPELLSGVLGFGFRV